MSRPGDMPVIFKLFWIAPILGGLILAGASFQAIQRGEQSAAWPVTDAEIVRVGGQGGWFMATRWGSYTWTSGGQKYTGSEVACCGARWNDYFDANGEKQVGDRIAIHVNPDNPADAVLMPGARLACWWPVIAGLGLAAAGLVVRRRILADDPGTGRGF